MLKRRKFAVVCSMATAALLAGCDGADEDAKNTPANGPVAEAQSANDSITVTFQLAGLMLVVPPAQSGGRTHVILPSVANPAHVAGMALGADSSQVCESYDNARGVCFVNLEDWELDTIGVFGAPTQTQGLALPERVVNVSQGSGGVHKVNLSAGGGAIFKHVIFRAGQPDTAACRLATWQYHRVGHQQGDPDRFPLVNLMYWNIRHPANRDFVLQFKPKSGGASVPVILDDVSNGTIRVLLAHVPQNEWTAIVTNTTINDTAPPELTHFHSYYNLLRHPVQGTPPGAGNRPLPKQPSPTGLGECPITITATASGDTVARFFRPAGIKTYACVVGTGDI